MPSLQPTSTSALSTLSFGASRPHAAARSTWIIAAAGLLFAVAAANLVCLSPRWYSSSFLSLLWQSSKMVVLTAATGAAAVRILCGLVADKPAAGPTSIALNLSAGWVFLPISVLLYQRNSPWMLCGVALVTLGMALGLRRLLPAAAAPSPGSNPPVDSGTLTSTLPSLYGLPPGDSPLLLASSIAILAQAACIFAANGDLLLATLPLCAGLFLFAWRWSAYDSRAAQWSTGKHPPLRQAVAAILLTALAIIPFSVGHAHGFSIPKPPPPPEQADASSGYYGVILYPPPKKKEIVAPTPHDDSFHAGVLTKPLNIPFDGPYWYFKAPNRRPGEKAHIAHALPTDVNVRSTNYQPLSMEAHQNLGVPISLDSCGEIDVALTNADTRPGPIALILLLTDTTAPGKPPQVLSEVPIASSQPDQIPLDRPPVKETLHFPIPPSRTGGSFNQITIAFMLSPRHARAGAKVSIDSFTLLPRR